MARIDWTRIFVEATGLRPTASEAAMPIRPTLMAAPRAAKPTCKFPLILFSFLFSPAIMRTRLPRGSVYSSNVCSHRSLILMPAHKHREYCRQQCEHEGLYQAHHQFEKIEGDWYQPAEPGY